MMPHLHEDEDDFFERCMLEEDEATCAALWDETRAVTNALERRAAPLEIRAKGRRLMGHAAVFGVEAKLPGMTEVLMPGAFAASLKSNPDILALWDHDPSRLLARTKSKTLRLAEDGKGLNFDLDLPDTSHGRDVLALAERGDLGGMSFGFHVARGGETWNGAKRTLTAVDLREISVVSSWPAYPSTVVSARSAGLSKPRIRLALARRYLDIIGGR
jgi:HK97 family phage prohead protease